MGKPPFDAVLGAIYGVILAVFVNVLTAFEPSREYRWAVLTLGFASVCTLVFMWKKHRVDREIDNMIRIAMETRNKTGMGTVRQELPPSEDPLTFEGFINLQTKRYEERRTSFLLLGTLAIASMVIGVGILLYHRFDEGAVSVKDLTSAVSRLETVTTQTTASQNQRLETLNNRIGEIKELLQQTRSDLSSSKNAQPTQSELGNGTISSQHPNPSR